MTPRSRRRSDRFTEEEMLAEIRRVASLFPNCTFKEYLEHAKIPVSVVLRAFGKFDLSKEAAGVAHIYRSEFKKRKERPVAVAVIPRREYIYIQSIAPEYEEETRDRSATILCLGDCGRMFFSPDKSEVRFCDRCKRFKNWNSDNIE